MKKILLLGGSAQQVVAIETARKLGYYTILCDFLPDNPGQYIADKFYPVSSTDMDAVLAIAREEMVHGVLAYASDPAAPTAAYVAEKLTGVDLVECAVKVAMGEKIELPEMKEDRGYWSYFAVHSLEDGILSEVKIKPSVLKNNVVENHIIKKTGDSINVFMGANTTLGCLVMKFRSMEEMLEMMDYPEKWIEVEVR